MHSKSKLGKNLVIDNVLDTSMEQVSAISVFTSTAISKQEVEARPGQAGE